MVINSRVNEIGVGYVYSKIGSYGGYWTVDMGGHRAVTLGEDNVHLHANGYETNKLCKYFIGFGCIISKAN